MALLLPRASCVESVATHCDWCQSGLDSGQVTDFLVENNSSFAARRRSVVADVLVLSVLCIGVVVISWRSIVLRKP